MIGKKVSIHLRHRAERLLSPRSNSQSIYFYIVAFRSIANDVVDRVVKANRFEIVDQRPFLLSRDQETELREQPLHLRALEEADSLSACTHMRALADWVRTYLMRPHPELGRSGHVCPFTSQAARLSLLRIGISSLGGGDQAAILRTMQHALRAFDGLPCKKSTRLFRTVIVGFPQCTDPAGIATLRSVQNAMRHHSIIRAKMIGLFEPNSEAEGLLNPRFRPLRSPVPALAIRMLVEQDAPFVMRNPLLAPVYLVKFPFAGTRRLLLSAVARGRKSSLMSWLRHTKSNRTP